jgi:putative transposase
VARQWISSRFNVSERRACALTCLARSTARYQARRQTDQCIATLQALANQHLGIGYRQLHKRMRRAGWKINHKRVYRLYCQMQLQQRRKKRPSRIKGVGRAPRPTMVNQMWAMDFMADRLTNGHSYRLLAVIDCHSRECLAIDANGSMSGPRVVRVLNQIASERGVPAVLVADNGPEFRSHAIQAWATHNSVQLHYIDPGRPTQNAFIESFNSIVRAECLELRDVDTLREVRGIVKEWQADYNHHRPHGSLADATPLEAARRSQRIPFRAVADRTTHSSGTGLMEKRKTRAFPSFPQALQPQLSVP